MRIAKVFSLLLLFTFLHNVKAQVWVNQHDGAFDPHNFSLRTYTTHDGLPSKSTTAALRDKNGLMWIGTENGLCKFDGYTFKAYVNIPGDSTSITSNYINALVEDKAGRIWVGTMDGLNIFDPKTERFTRFYHKFNQPNSLSNNKIWSLLCGRSGQVWVGTDNGFNRFINADKGFDVYLPNQRDKFALKGKSINSIIEDKLGDLWLGSWSSGLAKFNKKSHKFINYEQPHLSGQKNPNDVWNLYYGVDGQIWIATYWKGLFAFNPSTEKFISLKCPDGANTSVFSVVQKDSNTLLVGGNAGFYWVDTRTNSWQKLPDLINNASGEVYDDKHGIIWLCSINGLTQIDYKEYKFGWLPLNLKPREVKSMLVDGRKIWLSTNNGLFKYDFATGAKQAFYHNNGSKSLSSNELSKLYKDADGNLWIATENGFDKYDERSNTFQHHFHHSALSSLYNEDVFRDILEIKPGVFMLATDAGLKVFDSNANTFEHYYSDDKNPGSINNNHLYSLLKDADGMIWIGTYGSGLNRFNTVTKRFTAYTFNDKVTGSLSNNIVRSIFLDSRKNLWVCTSDGLNKFNRQTNSFETYSKKDGFSSNVFINIIEDSQGNLWVNTETGVSRFNPNNLQVKNFDESDGVYANSVIAKSQTGDIYLAGTTGIVHIDPARIKHNKEVAPVYFTDFQIFNKSIVPGVNSPLKVGIGSASNITLKHRQNMFSITFVALNYTHSERNSYAYKLEGFDRKWNYVGSQRKATYTNLNPGKYVFRVIAANNDGVWNKEGRTISITILPPWYQTWWAYLLYCFGLGFVVYGYIVYRDKQAKLKYEVKVAHLQSESEKKLNEKKLSFFTNISHEFRTPLTLIINPVKELLYKDDKNVDTTNLNIVYRNARRLLSLVDQLLLFRKADAEIDNLKIVKLNLVSLSKEVYLCFTHQARVKSITYNFNSASDHLTIYADREKTEIALFNLLSNAFKFTPDGGIITFEVSDNDENALIRVQDSGCGISPGIGDKLFNKFYQDTSSGASLKGGFGIGLFLVKSFINAMRGKINYESVEGEGTTFNIELPKGLEYALLSNIQDDGNSESVLLKELIEDEITANAVVDAANDEVLFDDPLTSETKTLLIIDDNHDVREYLKQIFKLEFTLYEASNGEHGFEMINEYLPDIVISDVMMQGMSGIELCNLVKECEATSHIPVILLTASSSPEIKLKGLEGGADDYISKPFDKEILKARVAGILKSKNNLQKYFYNAVTLNASDLKISSEYKDFLNSCIRIVEKHITDPDFNIQVLAAEIGMSRSKLYNKIKSISGQSSNSFIRFIRLRKAAEIFINSDHTILQTSYMVGIRDPRYFREQFCKQFNMNPSQYIKKFRKPFSNNLHLSPAMIKAHKGK
ncbi:two-component regulator propeller domain-containing protein [uncultured Mucilaginibacter sp.]|uniref:hybrid sensor histidine kinase/response regulator transcription factor n=1 Tax=uncultured Mucilaginibacter sp. TaxID=797541 RepID=UPI0025D1DE97|nr:two-component regulator propeller domain-containing protein [uncultured Mucilaginibacter sp.]